MKIIAVANQKGGVGKTTTTFNLGAALALEHDKKVLLIDFDPQANLSEYLSFSDDMPTVTNLVTDMALWGSAHVSASLKDCIRYNEENKLYYIPSDINLASAESYIHGAMSRETVLKRILDDEAASGFDYILIDCLPSLGDLLINALSASDELLIPVQTQKFSMDGLQTLIDLSEQVKTTVNPSLKIMGIIPTMVDNTNVSKRAIEALALDYKELCLKTVIHKSIEAAKSSESGTALCKTKSRLGEEYTKLAEEILKGVNDNG